MPNGSAFNPKDFKIKLINWQPTFQMADHLLGKILVNFKRVRAQRETIVQKAAEMYTFVICIFKL